MNRYLFDLMMVYFVRALSYVFVALLLGIFIAALVALHRENVSYPRVVIDQSMCKSRPDLCTWVPIVPQAYIVLDESGERSIYSCPQPLDMLPCLYESGAAPRRLSDDEELEWLGPAPQLLRQDDWDI